MADRDKVTVVALADFRTTGLPDSSYTHFDNPIVYKDDVLTVTKAQRAYLGNLVKIQGEDNPERDDYAARALQHTQPYKRHPSPYPHKYVPGKSTAAHPSANLVQGRLNATTQSVTFTQEGSPFGTGHADHPELYENQPTVTEADAEETQRTLRVKDAVAVTP